MLGLNTRALLFICCAAVCGTASAWTSTNGSNSAFGAGPAAILPDPMFEDNVLPLVLVADSGTSNGATAGYKATGLARPGSLGASSLAVSDGVDDYLVVNAIGTAAADFSDTGPFNNSADRRSSLAVIRFDFGLHDPLLALSSGDQTSSFASVDISEPGVPNSRFRVEYGTSFNPGNPNPRTPAINVTNNDAGRPNGIKSTVFGRGLWFYVLLFDTDVGETFPNFTAAVEADSHLSSFHQNGVAPDAFIRSSVYFSRPPISFASSGTIFDNYVYGDPLPIPDEGDFNFDGSVDHLDIDLLANEIKSTSGSIDEAIGGSPSSSFIFDINFDGLVNSDDTDYLVRDLIGTEYGDTNLDFKVDLVDLDNLGMNMDMPGGWLQGDFNGDCFVDLADLDILGMNFGYDGTSTAIPEAGGLQIAAMLLVSLSLGVVRMR